MTSGKRLAVAVGIGLLTVFGSLSAAHAQYRARPYYGAPPPAYRGVYRSGLTLGGAIGPGVIVRSELLQSCCGGAGMGELHLGGMLNPRLALVGDVFAAVRYWDDAIAGHGSTYSSFWTIALQYWVTNIIWLKGGLGCREPADQRREHTRGHLRLRATKAAWASWARSASRSCSPTTSRSISSCARATLFLRRRRPQQASPSWSASTGTDASTAAPHARRAEHDACGSSSGASRSSPATRARSLTRSGGAPAPRSR